jgi:hypothetical protein
LSHCESVARRASSSIGVCCVDVGLVPCDATGRLYPQEPLCPSDLSLHGLRACRPEVLRAIALQMVHTAHAMHPVTVQCKPTHAQHASHQRQTVRAICVPFESDVYKHNPTKPHAVSILLTLQRQQFLTVAACMHIQSTIAWHDVQANPECRDAALNLKHCQQCRSEVCCFCGEPLPQWPLSNVLTAKCWQPRSP